MNGREMNGRERHGRCVGCTYRQDRGWATYCVERQGEQALRWTRGVPAGSEGSGERGEGEGTAAGGNAYE